MAVLPRHRLDPPAGVDAGAGVDGGLGDPVQGTPIVEAHIDVLRHVELRRTAPVESCREESGDLLVNPGGGRGHEEHSVEQLAANVVVGEASEIVHGPAVCGLVLAHRSGHHGLQAGSLAP
jgi:hypothetical protein